MPVGNIVERMVWVALPLDWPVIHPLLSRGLFWQKRNTSYSPTCSNYPDGYYTYKTWILSIQSTGIQETNICPIQADYEGPHLWPNVNTSKYCLFWPEKLCPSLPRPEKRSLLTKWMKEARNGWFSLHYTARHLLRDTDTSHSALVVVSKRCLWWTMSTKVSSLLDDKCSGARRRSRALIS